MSEGEGNHFARAITTVASTREYMQAQIWKKNFDS